MNDRYTSLNKPQYQAVITTEGPLLLLAGAGSGKTRVLTHRIAYLIEECKVFPWRIMAITFTNKAAREMRERVDGLIGEGGKDVWISTFHSSCVRILRRFISHIGYTGSFSIYDTEDSKKMIREIMKDLNIDNKSYKDSEVRAAISSCKNKMVSVNQYIRDGQGNLRQEVIGKVFQEYELRLRKNNALDFDDLLLKTVSLLENHAEVLEYYQNLFHYIMVDEYQDTNRVQFRLVSLLADKRKNLCVVGDDDQSIYKFRGADIRNILDFERVYPQAQVISLEQNYRSTGNILTVANQVIKNNQKRKIKKLWTDQVQGEPVNYVMVNSEKEEAQYIAAEISSQVKDGRGYNDFAVLYRTNAQSRALEERLFREGIPYKLVGGVSFYQRKEIKDVLAYLKILNNSNDDVAVKRIINVPKRGIGEASIERIDKYCMERQISFYQGLSQVESISGVSRAVSRVKAFYNVMESLKLDQETGSLEELMDSVLVKTGYVQQLRNENTAEALERIENVKELSSKLIEYEESMTNQGEVATLAGFLEEVALVAEIDSVEQNQEQVVLMTFHSAKGLEFPVVFMAGMEEGLFPGYISLNSGDEEDIAEERRLCYVGITRAQKILYLISASARMLYGRTAANLRSRFIDEIPLELLNVIQYNQARIGQRTTDSKLTEGYKRRKVYNSAAGYSDKKNFGSQTGSLAYDKGDMVKHIKYGIGVVLDITKGGADYEVTVDFPSVGQKKLIATFAKLEKV